MIEWGYAMKRSLVAKIGMVLMLPGLALALSACEPEVGTEAWCEAQKEKPKGDWTFDETAQFTKHCVIDGTAKE